MNTLWEASPRASSHRDYHQLLAHENAVVPFVVGCLEHLTVTPFGYAWEREREREREREVRGMRSVCVCVFVS